MSQRPHRLSVGLVGFGSFGGFAARHLSRWVDLTVTDRVDRSSVAAKEGVAWGDLDAVAACRVVVLAVPVQNLESALVALAPRLAPGTLVVDVASVKVKPLEMMAARLPSGVDWIGTHPMFGPQSGQDGIDGLRVALCAPPSQRRARLVRCFLQRRLGLEVLEMTAQRHDHEIAYIQGLTHWVAKALREIELPDPRLATTAYHHLLAIEEILRHDSDDLFLTIERENPYVADARNALKSKLLEIEEWVLRQSEKG